MAQHKGSLGGGVFSIREVEYLESLPAVDRVRSGRIVYNDAFKRDCIRRYRNGESPAEIFRSAGLDSALIGYKRIERSIARWKATLGDDGARPMVPRPSSLQPAAAGTRRSAVVSIPCPPIRTVATGMSTTLPTPCPSARPNRGSRACPSRTRATSSSPSRPAASRNSKSKSAN